MDVSEIISIHIWERILENPIISPEDVFTFSSSCKRFREFLLPNKSVWKAKISQKWPTLIEQLQIGHDIDWFQIYLHRRQVAKDTKELLHALSSRYMREDRINNLSDSAFTKMAEYMNRSEQDGSFLIDELRCILNLVPKHLRLTDKYYSGNALRYLVKQSLIPKWRQWLANHQLLEEGAWLFAQWLSPGPWLEDSILDGFFDRMVKETKQKLAETNKRHPLLKRDAAIDHANLRGHMWSVPETREIIDALTLVFCTLHGFRGNSDDYYNIKNSLLHEVIDSKLGIPITLSILFHAIARRLGIYCEPVNFPGHFLLRFLDNPELSESQKYTYIDVFNSCRLMRQSQVWATRATPQMQFDSNYFAVPTSDMVLIRMMHNIASADERLDRRDTLTVCGAWELGMVLAPADFQTRCALAQLYLRMDINIEKALHLMEDFPPEPGDQVATTLRSHYIQMARTKLMAAGIERDAPTKPPKLRSHHPHVKHAVGMIMKHKAYNYTCVITAWDPICAATDGWKTQMGVQNLSRKDQQPFYHVLAHDGTERYAAEENMVFEPEPKMIAHPEVGRFFQECCGTHYKMNPERMKDYPEDEPAVIGYVNKSYPQDL